MVTILNDNWMNLQWDNTALSKIVSWLWRPIVSDCDVLFVGATVPLLRCPSCIRLLALCRTEHGDAWVWSQGLTCIMSNATRPGGTVPGGILGVQALAHSCLGVHAPCPPRPVFFLPTPPPIFPIFSGEPPPKISGDPPPPLPLSAPANFSLEPHPHGCNILAFVWPSCVGKLYGSFHLHLKGRQRTTIFKYDIHINIPL